MCWQGCGEIRNVKWCGCYGKHYGGSSKKLKMELPYDPVIPLLGIYPKELKARCCTAFVHPRSQQHYSQCSSQKVEVTQAVIDRWMDKQNMVYMYKGIVFSLKKEGNSDTRYNMDKPWEHSAKWNNQKHIYCMILIIWGTPSRQIHGDRRKEDGYQGLGERGPGALFNGGRVSVLQDGKSSGNWLQNNVSVLNTIEPYT